MNRAGDLIILGAGPAGAAAGIAARLRGLRVELLDRAPGVHAAPGETLHPGVAAIFRQLGVLEEIEAASPLRPEMHAVTWGARHEIASYGADANGPWRGYQIRRSELTHILLRRFENLGGRVTWNAGEIRPILCGSTVEGVGMRGSTLRAPFTIDASGRAGILRRALRIGQQRVSRTLLARYGYRRGVVRHCPTITGDADGWAWTAQVAPDLVAWVRVAFDRHKGRGQPPFGIVHMPDAGGSGVVDVTWRIADTIAGGGFFLAGDACALVDPAASHGVLRAMMSGMMAAHNAAEAAAGAIGRKEASSAYDGWMRAWFDRDVAAMQELYSRLGADWAVRANPSLAPDRHGGLPYV